MYNLGWNYSDTSESIVKWFSSVLEPPQLPWDSADSVIPYLSITPPFSVSHFPVLSPTSHQTWLDSTSTTFHLPFISNSPKSPTLTIPHHHHPWTCFHQGHHCLCPLGQNLISCVPVPILHNHSATCETLLALRHVFSPLEGSFPAYVVVVLDLLQCTPPGKLETSEFQNFSGLLLHPSSLSQCQSSSLFPVSADSCISPVFQLLLLAHTLWQQLPNWPPTSNLFQLINPSPTFSATSSF